MKTANLIPDTADCTMQDALLYELRQLYYSEIVGLSKHRELERTGCVQPDDDAMMNYLSGATVKIQLLENIFKYLMVEPQHICVEIITELTDEAMPLLSYHGNQVLHKISAIGYLQVINAYHISGYRTAYAFAAQLGLDIVTESLQQLLELELSQGKDLADAAMDSMHAQSA